MARSSGSFKPGQSGNPAGCPKIVREVRDLARQHTALAIDTLVKIAGNAKMDPRARVAAANALLDRAYGKPSQHVELESTLPASVSIITPLTRGAAADPSAARHAVAVHPS